ncbi:TnsA endonuclease N-terminal domain-containing protein, partial [Brevibacillus reuszeri]
MLSEDEFKLLCLKHNLSATAQNVIQQIRASEPVRRVQSNAKNVSGFYSSNKMGMAIQFESHTLELAAIYEKEHDENVLEYYDQPSLFCITYEVNGRNRGHNYTPDFFVITSDWIGWEEWKTEEELISLSERSPTRYCRDKSGKWRCPPSERYAEQFDLSFRVRSSKEINWIYQSNIRLLEDYLLDDELAVSKKTMQTILDVVKGNPGITVEKLLSQRETAFTSDDIYSLIVLGELYVDLHTHRMVDVVSTPVFIDSQTAQAFKFMERTPTVETQVQASSIEVQVGTEIQWDGQRWIISNVGTNSIFLKDNDDLTTDITYEAFKTLANQGKIKGINRQFHTENDQDAHNILRQASKEDLEEANRRYKIISPRLQEDYITPIEHPSRTVRRWISKYHNAERKFGNGFLGLIPEKKRRGNHLDKLPVESKELALDFILNQYETIKQKNVLSVFNLYQEECKDRNIKACSYTTFCKYVHLRPKYEQKRNRKGKKAAYDKEEWYWEIDYKTPRHGDRPFEICHIDHTELDIELVCSKTKRNLGKPWATFMVDAFTRRILAIHVTFEKPSYRACMMTLRECVKRHSRLPKFLVVDGGKEFESIYFESLLALNRCHKKKRPGAKPRFGTVCERLFGTANTMFIYNLLGNTQIMKNVRQVTKEVNP